MQGKRGGVAPRPLVATVSVVTPVRTLPRPVKKSVIPIPAVRNRDLTPTSRSGAKEYNAPHETSGLLLVGMSKVYTTMFLYGHKILHCIPAKSAGIPLRMTNIKWFTFLRFSRAVLGGLRLEGDIKAPPGKKYSGGTVH